MKVTKLKWKWIKIWGSRYVEMLPNKNNKYFILYHHRMFEVELWDEYFKCHDKKYSKK